MDKVLTVEQHGAHAVELKVHGHAVNVVFKGDLLAVTGMRKAFNPHHTVANTGNDAVFIDGRLVFK